jgi:hypothetical protein
LSALPSVNEASLAYTITPRTVIVIELIARLVSVKTVTHCTTVWLAST